MKTRAHSMPPALVGAAAMVALLLAPAGHAAERAIAKVACAPTDQKHVYDCEITLRGKRSGKPVNRAKVVIGAQMPSMPMVHNIKPVTATAGPTAGMYTARIELEMTGEWAFTIDVSGPIRDRIVHKLRFGGAGDASREKTRDSLETGDGMKMPAPLRTMKRGRRKK